MSLSPSLRNRVRRLEEARDPSTRLDRVEAMRQADRFLSAMTPAELEAWKQDHLERARQAVAAAAHLQHPPYGSQAALAMRMHEATLRAHAMRLRRLSGGRMADSCSADTSTGAGRGASAVTSPPPRPSTTGDLEQ